MIEEYKKNGYVIFDDLLPEEEYKKIRRGPNAPAAVHISILPNQH